MRRSGVTDNPNWSLIERFEIKAYVDVVIVIIVNKDSSIIILEMSPEI